MQLQCLWNVLNICHFHTDLMTGYILVTMIRNIIANITAIQYSPIQTDFDCIDINIEQEMHLSSVVQNE